MANMDVIRELLLEFKKNPQKPGYGKHKECEALISYVLNNMTKSQLPDLKPQVKNDEESIKYREEGNYFFVNGNDSKAIELYSKSLAYAKSKKMMAYARANRSAALYRKKHYIECILDINAALTTDYPTEKANNLRERGQKALNRIKELLKVSDSENSAEILKLFAQYEKRQQLNGGETKIEDNKETEDVEIGFKQVTIEQIVEEEKKSEGNVSISAVSGIAPDPRFLVDEGKPEITYGPNKEAPDASKGLKICYSKKYGRHIIATKPFRPGDILAVEEPFARILYLQKYYTHCHHCLNRNYNLIPCPNCPISMYCSEKCQDLAWKAAHNTECPVLSTLASLLNVNQDKIDQLSKIMRVIIELTNNGKSFDELRKDLEYCEFNTDRRTAGFSKEGKFSSRFPSSALSLATNFETRPLGDISALACIAALTVILLATQTNFFGEKYPEERLQDINNNPNVKFCSTLLLRSAVVMSSNSFSVQIEPGNKCGSGLYVFHSLFNHACAPNTIRHFDGLTMITRALVPISPGEQVFTSYTGGYQYTAKAERRRKILEDYYFECDCSACAEDWPLYSEIMSKHIGSIANDKTLTQKLEPLRARIRENKYDVETIKSIVELLYKETKMPCEEMVTAMQYLKSYFLGKFYLTKTSVTDKQK